MKDLGDEQLPFVLYYADNALTLKQEETSTLQHSDAQMLPQASP